MTRHPLGVAGVVASLAFVCLLSLSSLSFSSSSSSSSSSSLVFVSAAGSTTATYSPIPAPDQHFLLSSTNTDTPINNRPPKKGDKVLVLGSHGLVGRATVKHLKRAGYVVEEVENRRHIDLRLPGALDRFQNISFVMFLACEVGGSKYIHDTTRSVQLDIIANNMKIYQTVFDYVGLHQIPFIFTSTSLVLEADAYGTTKRVGESWVKAMKLGKIVRLWNAYGSEPIGEKSHVIADWAYQCVKNKRFNGLTSGEEERSFVHTSDCADALITLMEHYDQADFISDIAGADWSSLRDVANSITGYFDSRHLDPCVATFNTERQAVPRAMIEPKRDSKLWSWWQPRISLDNGVAYILDFYRQEVAAAAAAADAHAKDEL